MPRPAISNALLVGTVCLLAVTPFFWHGSPSGHDFEFHMSSWMEVLSQWRQGILYPRWAALAHWGFGEARFLFYPPTSWALGAALGAILPWKMVPGAYVWLVLTLSGLSMFRLAREWLPSRDALFAAVFYAVNPYHLVIVYWRSAYAELLASALLPLLLLCVLQLDERNFRPALRLALVLAASWLTNAPAAVMIHYSLALLAAMKAALDRSWRPLAQATVAIVLGAGLASFYLVPAAYEETWVNIGEVLSPGVRPQDNFVFTTIADPEHNRFNLLVSAVAAAEIALAALAVWFARRWRNQQKAAWTLLSGWLAAAVLIMFAFTNPLWQHLPKLRFVQLPWRWLLCLNVGLVLLLPMAFRRLRLRALAAAFLLSVVLYGAHRIQPPWWDTALDIREMVNALSDGTGYEGTDEYVSAGADPYELNQSAPRVSGDSAQPVPTKIASWRPDEKEFTARFSAPQDLTLRLFNYPAWRATVNGHSVRARSTEVTGQMVIPMPAGECDVRISFQRTPDRTAGGAISLLSLGVLIFAWARTRKTSTAPTS